MTSPFGTTFADDRVAAHANGDLTMQASDLQPALPLRQHTILGVCEGIGEDFGFAPILLRVPLAVCVLWSPAMAVAGYLVLGLVVLASRLLFPKAKAAPAQSAPVALPQPASAANCEIEPELPLAA
jgi:phage shock protein PspC (stress-responsive transcriptional regulator)